MEVVEDMVESIRVQCRLRVFNSIQPWSWGASRSERKEKRRQVKTPPRHPQASLASTTSTVSSLLGPILRNIKACNCVHWNGILSPDRTLLDCGRIRQGPGRVRGLRCHLRRVNCRSDELDHWTKQIHSYAIR